MHVTIDADDVLLAAGRCKYVSVLGHHNECHGRLLLVQTAAMVLSESYVVYLVQFSTSEWLLSYLGCTTVRRYVGTSCIRSITHINYTHALQRTTVSGCTANVYVIAWLTFLIRLWLVVTLSTAPGIPF